MVSPIILLVCSNHPFIPFKPIPQGKFRKLLFRSFEYNIQCTTKVHSVIFTVSHIRELSNLLLYPDDSYIVFQWKNIEETEQQLNGNFKNICESFLDYKLCIYFDDDKTKSILFASKRKIKGFQNDTSLKKIHKSNNI